MKVYISADMEGITGITGITETKKGEEDYSRARQLMTEDVNAAIEGAIETGASEILVNDSHWDMRNILIEKLHPKARLIGGNLKPLSMMQGLDSTFKAVFFIGYHSMSGTEAGIRAHTYADEIYEVCINDIRVGELGMNAAYAGALGVPVALVTGDDKLASEAKNLLGVVETVVVKKGISVDSGFLLPPEESHRLIKEGARRAMENVEQYKPFMVREPVEIKLVFKHVKSADLLANLPYIKRQNGYAVSMKFDNYIEGYRTMIASLELLFA